MPGGVQYTVIVVTVIFIIHIIIITDRGLRVRRVVCTLARTLNYLLSYMYMRTMYIVINILYMYKG